jgi:probable F420-dependent oxidoreductase
MKPFRFGIQTSAAADAAAWRARAQRIEELGYSSLLIPDHFGDQWAPLVALTVAAEATERLKVGALVFDNDYRHPVVLAKEIATLDLASGGRVEFGIGAGWMKSDYDQSGIAYDSAGVRIDRLEEAIAIYKALFAEGKATYAGTHYTLANAECIPGPVARPHPPLVIGGGGQRVLSLAGREADIIGLNALLSEGFIGAEAAASVSPERTRQKVAWVRDAAGSRFDDIELQCLTFFVQVVPNRRETVAKLAPLFGVDPETAMDIPIALIGTVDEICDQLQQRREEYGLSYWVLHEAEMEDFAPVVERLTGR